MATDNRILDLAFEADEDLSEDQYKFVVLTSDGKVRRPDTETEAALGILQNAPGSGMPANVRVMGVSKLQANAELGIGTFVMPEYVSATDAGKGKSSVLAPQYTRAVVLESSGAEDDLCGVLLTSPFPAINDSVAHVMGATSVTTAGAKTYTAAELIGGIILRDPAGAARNDVTPTAALIVAAIAGAIVGSAFEFTIKNTADADELLTLTAGAGVTLSGGMTVPYNHSRRFLAVCTNVTADQQAVTIYGLGLAPNTPDKFGRTTVSAVNTAGAATYTAAALVGGLVLRDPAGGARNDVTPTAAQIVAAIPGAVVGSSFEFVVRNTADEDEAITLTAGAGVTLSGTMTIALNNSKRFLAVVTNIGVGTEAVTIYSLGTVTH